MQILRYVIQNSVKKFKANKTKQRKVVKFETEREKTFVIDTCVVSNNSISNNWLVERMIDHA